MADPILKVINHGPLSTIQDLGRLSFQRYGFTTAGAMDDFALRVGNRLVGNRQNDAAIEMMMFGGEYLVLQDCIISITGADMTPQVDGNDIPLWESILVRKDSVISFKNRRNGMWTYLCVQGGIDVPQVLGSRSTDLKIGFGGHEGRKLQAGDIIYGSKILNKDCCGNYFPPDIVNKYYNWEVKPAEVRVVLGPEKDHFTEKGVKTFLSEQYEISERSNRQGYQMRGAKIEHSEKGPNILTNATPLGAVQVPGNGNPITLMRDKQTTGGYPKIATVITPDISKLAQQGPGDKVKFVSVGIEEAHQLLRQWEDMINTTPLKKVSNVKYYNIKIDGVNYKINVGEVM